MADYAELQVTSNFTFLRGGSHPEELVLRARELGLDALALTDRNTLAGVVRAHVAAKEVGVRFVVGARLDLLPDGAPLPKKARLRTDAFDHEGDPPIAWGAAGPSRSLLCLPKDRAAYGRLSALLSTGQRRVEKGLCALFLDDVLNASKGQILIALPPPELPDPGLEDFLGRLAGGAAGDVYLAAHHLYRGDDAARLAHLEELASRCRTPLVATGDVLYHGPDRRPLQDVLTCIRSGCTIDEAGLRLTANAERHLKPADEMARLFRDHPDAIARSREIVRACRFSLDELAYDYPIEAPPEQLSEQAWLERLTWEGASRLYPDGVPDKVRDLLVHEFGLIEELNYAPYFLTVWDIVRYAKSKGILCQGRGSAANSAVCYCLGITAVDPGKFDLLFERFVSAERNEPPDIDVDFEHERREEVIQYIYEKYGREHAGLTATVIHYRSRSAIREVGKAMGLSADVVSALASSVWGWSEGGVDAKNARERGLDPGEPRLAMALELAHQLIGFPRHLSQHVGGFVLTRSRLDHVVPVANAAMDGRTVIEWDKDDLDALNILKIDVLALGMLTCIRKAFDLLERHYGKRLGLTSVPPEDPAVYAMLGRADSLGVFQVESRAQMTMLPRLRPQAFYDLIIEVAIVRPGPIQGDMVHPYLRRRNGEEAVDYPSDALRGVLQKTLGVPLFQEQAMQIAIIGAGFTPSEADRLRRAMATFKRVGTIDRFGQRFIEGMVANGYPRAFAEKCFKQIEGFGTYGFPESHAASFALLVYVSSWLKCHYPDVFACALLNSQPMGFYAPAQIVRDAREHGVSVLPVDVNASAWDCTLEEPRGTDPSGAGASMAEPADAPPAPGHNARLACAARCARPTATALMEPGSATSAPSVPDDTSGPAASPPDGEAVAPAHVGSCEYPTPRISPMPNAWAEASPRAGPPVLPSPPGGGDHRPPTSNFASNFDLEDELPASISEDAGNLAAGEIRSPTGPLRTTSPPEATHSPGPLGPLPPGPLPPEPLPPGPSSRVGRPDSQDRMDRHARVYDQAVNERLPIRSFTALSANGRRDEPSPSTPSQNGVPPHDLGGAVTGRTPVHAVNGSLSSSTHLRLGWSMRPWESVPVPRTGGADSQDRMDRHARVYDQAVNERLPTRGSSALSANGRRNEPSPPAPPQNREAPHDVGGAVTGRTPVLDVDGSLSSSAHLRPGWSMRPWESVPVPRTGGADSQDRMDQDSRPYGQVIDETLRAPAGDEAALLDPHWPEARLPAPEDDRRGGAGSSLSRGVDDLGLGVNGSLSSSAHLRPGWSMRPWESVPVPGTRGADSQDRMDQDSRPYGQVIDETLRAPAGDEAALLDPHWPEARLLAPEGDRRSGAGSSLSCGVDDLGLGVDGSLSSSAHLRLGWSMRPWESVPVPGTGGADSQDRMDQGSSAYGQEMNEALGALAGDEAVASCAALRAPVTGGSATGVPGWEEWRRGMCVAPGRLDLSASGGPGENKMPSSPTSERAFSQAAGAEDGWPEQGVLEASEGVSSQVAGAEDGRPEQTVLEAFRGEPIQATGATGCGCDPRALTGFGRRARKTVMKEGTGPRPAEPWAPPPRGGEPRRILCSSLSQEEGRPDPEAAGPPHTGARPSEPHAGGAVRAGDAAGSAAEAGPRLALRLGFRQVKGLQQDEMARVVELRHDGYASLADLRHRAGVRQQALDHLARADAFRSLRRDRRGAVWDAIGLDRTGHEIDPPPLFAWARPSAQVARSAVAQEGGAHVAPSAVAQEGGAHVAPSAVAQEGGAQVAPSAVAQEGGAHVAPSAVAQEGGAHVAPSAVAQEGSAHVVPSTAADDNPAPTARSAAATEKVTLPAMSEGQEVSEDYRSLRLTLRRHPLALVRARLARRVIQAEALARTENGRWVEVAGLVLVRQRPGTASGVIFITIEDESGVANLVVWPKVFERFRKVVLGAQLITVRGRVQKEGLVIHVIADRLSDRSDLLRDLADDGGETSGARADSGIEAPVARADRVKRGGARRSRSRPPTIEAPLAHADGPKGGGDAPDPRDPGWRPRDLNHHRARTPVFGETLARADEVRRPVDDVRNEKAAQDTRLKKKVQGFKSRDFH